MCTFFLFFLISKLANGLTMGNKSSQTRTDFDPSKGTSRKLHSIISEEDYLPMTRSMRKALIEGRRFQRVLPFRQNDNFGNSTNSNKDFPSAVNSTANVITNEDIEINGNDKPSKTSTPDSVPSDNVHESRGCVLESDIYKLTPIVTVVNQIEVDEKSKSLPNARVNDDKEVSIYALDSSPRKSLITNRQYSLIDMRTGLKKSRFTLDLEDRLRKSKRELGFDEHLSGWKEFSFKVDKSKEGGRPQTNLDRGTQGNISSRNKSVEYCTHNCQILGLCSVGRPRVLPSKTRFLPTVFRDEIIAENNINNLRKLHGMKEGCSCDLCTLAFLTDMNCHGGTKVTAKHKSKNSVAKSDRSNRIMKEKIQIVDSSFGKQPIEISVRSNSADTRSSFLTNCSNLSTETKIDCTNSRIKKMFKQNDSTDIREIYTNPNSTYNDNSIEEFPSKSKELCEAHFSTEKFNPKSTFKEFGTSSKTKYAKRSSSTMTESFASSSSLSTVLSYRRVRQIFQTIIEGNRVRRRTKLEIHKFKEMEELGLGKFRNNRWYPSECKKTYSIWRNMNENVQGLQGEFKKHNKATNTT